MKERMRGSIPLDEAKSALDSALEIGASIAADSSSLDARTTNEIETLLKSLLVSRMRYEDSGKQRSAAYLYVKLYARYRMLSRTLTSTEDFLERVATRDMLGRTLYLVSRDGQRQRVRDHLSQVLVRIRELAASRERLEPSGAGE